MAVFCPGGHAQRKNRGERENEWFHAKHTYIEWGAEASAVFDHRLEVRQCRQGLAATTKCPSTPKNTISSSTDQFHPTQSKLPNVHLMIAAGASLPIVFFNIKTPGSVHAASLSIRIRIQTNTRRPMSIVAIPRPVALWPYTWGSLPCKALGNPPSSEQHGPGRKHDSRTPS